MFQLRNRKGPQVVSLYRTWGLMLTRLASLTVRCVIPCAYARGLGYTSCSRGGGGCNREESKASLHFLGFRSPGSPACFILLYRWYGYVSIVDTSQFLQNSVLPLRNFHRKPSHCNNCTLVNCLKRATVLREEENLLAAPYMYLLCSLALWNMNAGDTKIQSAVACYTFCFLGHREWTKLSAIAVRM